ncbi:MAG: dinitrogenase iron-molybdenum cofactor biosynthesis protein [Thermogutta sp.]|nr:dinitrogenase iron-molybdenum cofactor biosynthesis protein [Thermogutta sp.]
MKLAVTAQGRDLDSPVDPRFGRARYFLLIDTETGQVTACDNAQNLNAVQGAGVQAAQTVVRLGAEGVLTGNVGPKAFATLQAGKVAIYPAVTGTVREALEAFRSGRLQPAAKPNVEGHWA